MSRKLERAVFLAASSGEPEYLERYKEKAGIRDDRISVGNIGEHALIEWNYQKAIAISNEIMPSVFRAKYKEAASARRHLAHILRYLYYVAILLVLFVIFDQSADVFSGQFRKVAN